MDYKLYIGFVIIGMIVEIAPITINYSGTENETTQAPTTEDPNSFSTPITINYSGTENETTQSPTTEGPNSFSTPVVINSVGSGTENGTTPSPTTEDPNSFSTPVVINYSGTENETTQSPTTEDPNSFSTPVEINYSGAENETTQSPTTEGPNSFSTRVVMIDSGTENGMTQSPTTENPNSCSSIRPCNNSGTCENGTCTCTHGFMGTFCEVPTVCPPSACNINNTQNCSVEMENGSYIYSCSCLPFYKGKQCEIYDFCEGYPCQNGGHCELLYPNPESMYSCDCHTGDPNNDCRLNDRDNCVARPPSNPDAYITCIDQIDSFKMYCSPGYSGEQSGCTNTVKPELYCDRNGAGYCLDEGYCKPLCNVDICNGTENCKFTADPYNATGFIKEPDCVKAFGDGYDHPNCSGEDTLFDGFDATINGLRDCSPFFDTFCTRDFGNRDCRPECNNSDCLYDGFDCSNRVLTELAGAVIVELKGPLGSPLNVTQNKLSMMLRSGVNLTIEKFKDEPETLLSLKITNTVFTDIEYAGKFLAAVVAKRPRWLDGAKIKDIFVCPAGSYSGEYSDKCRLNCSSCNQEYEICDWQTGECLYGCRPDHWGGRCKPCDKCKQEGELCDSGSGECRCKAGYWGPQCSSCDTCKEEGEICNNATGECLHGCKSKDFYDSMCIKCPQNCIGGCYEKGYCISCLSNRHGEFCENVCDEKCQKGTCDRNTGVCACQSGYYWSTNDERCDKCSDGCKGQCDVTSRACTCKDGYYGNKCTFQCMENCLNGTCHVNGTCDKGCDSGYYDPMCDTACPIGCNGCARDGGLCEGNCKPGYEGSTCEKSSGKSGYIDVVTDNTGVIIGVVISLLLVALILFVAFRYWRKRKSSNYVTEDEEIEAPRPNDSSTTRIHVHTNMHMQPTSPLPGHSLDTIELDEKQNLAVYAGPGRGQSAENGDNGKRPEENEPGDDKSQLANANTDDAADNKADDTSKINEKCVTSVVMEIGLGGRVLSVSDGDEEKSSALNKEVELPIGEEAESMEDDSTIAEPPRSPLGEVRVPLASEENTLTSLGPKEIEHDAPGEPAGLELEKEEAKESKRSRPSSSSSSSSISKKSSKGDKHEITAEM